MRLSWVILWTFGELFLWHFDWNWFCNLLRIRSELILALHGVYFFLEKLVILVGWFSFHFLSYLVKNLCDVLVVILVSRVRRFFRLMLELESFALLNSYTRELPFVSFVCVEIVEKREKIQLKSQSRLIASHQWMLCSWAVSLECLGSFAGRVLFLFWTVSRSAAVGYRRSSRFKRRSFN